jgi:hypothetical protein
MQSKKKKKQLWLGHRSFDPAALLMSVSVPCRQALGSPQLLLCLPDCELVNKGAPHKFIVVGGVVVLRELRERESVCVCVCVCV